MQDELRETHFAALVVGTGLTQSIVAAALAAASRPIIHVDEHNSYGGPHASLSLLELSEWARTNNIEHIRIDDTLVSRQYAISLAPQLVPATGPFVAALVNSGVARYGSFVMPKRVVVATCAGIETGEAPPTAQCQFRTVPSNKQDVFRDKSVSLVQKRRLIKFLVFASGEFEGSSELQGKESTPLLEFVQSTFGLEKDLAEALVYAVAFCTSPSDPTLPGLTRTRTYLRSVGRYGPSPFLIGHYGGAGELAQGFCRTCAVMGGTYVLGRRVVSITRGHGHSKDVEQDQQSQTHREWTTASGKKGETYHPPSTFEGYGVEGVDVPSVGAVEGVGAEAGSGSTPGADPVAVTSPSTTSHDPAQPDPLAPPAPQGPLFRIQLEGFAAPFTANALIGPKDWLAHTLDGETQAKIDNPTHTIRGVLVIDSPDSFTFGQSADGVEGSAEPRLDESLLVFPPSSGLGGQSVVSVLVNGAGTMSCPDGKCVLYFTAQTPTLDESPKTYLEPYVRAVLDGCTPQPDVHAEIFWREKEVEKVVLRKADAGAGETRPADKQNEDYTTMHLTEGADAAAREAERVFWEALGERPGEDGKGTDGAEFFARVGREEDDLDDI